MINSILAALIILFSQPSQAQSSTFMECQVDTPKWAATFVIDSVGSSFLEFSHKKGAQKFECDLKMRQMIDGRNAVIPMIMTAFTITECRPALGALQTEVLDWISLDINLLNKQPVGRVQWLVSEQPTLCKVKKLRLEDLSDHISRWKQGKWGRSTASHKN